MLEIIFDWKFFWVIFFITLPGLFLSLGGFTRAYWPFIRTHIRNPGKLLTILLYMFFILTVTISSIATGIILAPSINARFIYFQALIIGKNTGPAFLFEFLHGLLFGFPFALIFLAGYYYFFRKHLVPQKVSAAIFENIRKNIDEKTVYATEKSRNHLGLSVRIFFNAIVGEVIFRWGIQSLFVYLALQITANLNLATTISIFLTSLIYGWIHSALNTTISRDNSSILKIASFSLNFGISLVFGFLYWRYGIASAMSAHILLHIIWYPLDIFYYRKAPDEV